MYLFLVACTCLYLVGSQSGTRLNTYMSISVVLSLSLSLSLSFVFFLCDASGYKDGQNRDMFSMTFTGRGRLLGLMPQVRFMRLMMFHTCFLFIICAERF